MLVEEKVVAPKNRIRILRDEIANAIAAGEVVERPVSVVKELIENSIDAGATEIFIELKSGGQKLISVRDNGSGMTQDDALLAFERHATSKVETLKDIQSISTLGFRGEALPSIAAVGRVEMTTRHEETLGGTLIRIEGGVLKKVAEVGAPVGTTVSVKNLFYNLPVRKKFMKSVGTEMNHVVNIISTYVLTYPQVSFRVMHNNREVINSSGLSSLSDAIRFIHGKEVAENLVPLDFSCILSTRDSDLSFPLRVTGFVTRPSVSRPTSRNVTVFVNRRPVNSRIVLAAMKEGYHTILPPGRFPVAVLDMRVDPLGIDVNFHPTKQEIKFLDETGVFSAVRSAVAEALGSGALIMGLGEATVEVGSRGGEVPSELASGQNQSAEFEGMKHEVEDFQEFRGSESGDPSPTPGVQADGGISSSDPGRDSDGSGKRRADAAGAADSARVFSEGTHGGPDANQGDSGGADPRTARRVPENSGPMQGKFDFSPPQGIHETGFDRHRRIADARPVGQLFNTYIVAESNGEMLLFDQHIVHERILYENLMNTYYEADFAAQGLLFPAIIELSKTDQQILHKNMYVLSRLGFTIEHFGANNFLVKTVPVVLGKIEEKEVIFEILDSLMTTLYVKKIEEIKEGLIIKTACHGAVKAGEGLDIETMDRLLKALAKTKNPYTCPHGRPIVVSMSESEIKKKFKRS